MSWAALLSNRLGAFIPSLLVKPVKVPVAQSFMPLLRALTTPLANPGSTPITFSTARTKPPLAACPGVK